ncbi:allantoate amidohydrolase [Horticoccus sp. 23ND18S-11]|uniref:allantoate amidohydrolase n=1 Tax=Horticoccus sp. 23ND18S-11 TaxID=3391832 RepID=UPI0039C8C96C
MAREPTQQLTRWLNELARITDEPGKLTRTFLSPAMRRANARVGEWMRAAGLAVREDSVGNLIGRLEGSRPGAKTLLLGSHLDTVRDAGRFDGALGVLLPLVALDMLRQQGRILPYAVEVLGFSEEEGVRFSSAYLGSKGFTGTLRAADLKLRDADGIQVRDTLETLNGETFTLPRAAHRRSDLLGYLEVHIEQGPVLEAQDLAVSVVSAIAGQSRGRLTFYGQAGHAGTTPMGLRRDALAGAAAFISTVEGIARTRPPLVATVGTLAVSPGAPNVIPGEVTLSLDVRHPRDRARRAALSRMLGLAEWIARRRGLRCTWELTQDGNAVACDPKLTRVLAETVRKLQGRCPALVSGAGHDAVVMSALTPVAMLFVRCRAGRSHHPDEYAAPEDLRVALRATLTFLERFAG